MELSRHACLWVVVELFDALAYRVAERDLRQIVLSHFVLSLDPRERCCRRVVLERTVWVCHRVAEIVVDCIVRRSLRISEAGLF